eukprot:SAG11_NODE_2613_length_3172_cov_2.450700_2_plen_364_part_01
MRMHVHALPLLAALAAPVAAGSAAAAAASATQIDKVHIVWMNHLDVGFTNNIASVMNEYFHVSDTSVRGCFLHPLCLESNAPLKCFCVMFTRGRLAADLQVYFPRAISTAAAVNTPGKPPVFKYTSHAWLLDLFLDCPRQLGLACPAGGGASRLGVSPDNHPGCLVCPNATLREDVIRAIREDVITWHAFPFNAEPELADAGLLLGAIDSVHALDARFGKANKAVISQRDVPGVSRGIVPLMHQRGIKAFSEGCNAQIQPPQTPPIFNWTDLSSSTSVIMMLHQRGYGVAAGSGGSEQRRRRTEESLCAGLMGRGESLQDVVQVGGFNEALMYAFISDNQGPPLPGQVHTWLDCIANASGGAGL